MVREQEPRRNLGSSLSTAAGRDPSGLVSDSEREAESKFGQDVLQKKEEVEEEHKKEFDCKVPGAEQMLPDVELTSSIQSFTSGILSRILVIKL